VNTPELINALNRELLMKLMDDLNDPMKCSPGLYTVIRGIINDNREVLDSISHKELDTVEEALKTKAPFRFKSAAIG
jgi:hypothetical protein